MRESVTLCVTVGGDYLPRGHVKGRIKLYVVRLGAYMWMTAPLSSRLGSTTYFICTRVTGEVHNHESSLQARKNTGHKESLEDWI